MSKPTLASIKLPDFGEPVTEPVLDKTLYQHRLATLRRRMKQAGFDAVVIYGDREHVANISWASGYDPRFEEAILIVTQDRVPTLLAGNEGFPYAEMANGTFERVLWQHLSLLGQPRDKPKDLATIFKSAGLSKGLNIGLAGWKGYETEEGEFDPDWFETPHYLVESLRSFGTVKNAAQLFMNPQDGLRVINEVNQLAAFEVAATRSSDAVKRVIQSIRPGISEYQALTAMLLDGFPQSTHINFCSGPRAKYGLPSPSTRVIEPGDPIVLGVGLMGALNCRAGFMVSSADELPADIQDYVDKLVAPYFDAAVAWYETIGIGVTGGAVYEAVISRLGDPFFGIGLTPGHLIHLDEWVHSPVTKGSTKTFKSGMAIQCDIIPATNTPYFMSNIEDGIALADEALREDFAARYPDAWARIEARRKFMIEILGIKLKPEILPFSNMPAWLPPFWLGADKAMKMNGN